MAGTMELDLKTNVTRGMVSMKSGLDGRNNGSDPHRIGHQRHVSMKTGLDGRNNRPSTKVQLRSVFTVSMKSGLDGRNNRANGSFDFQRRIPVSMKSGLDGRNNY